MLKNKHVHAEDLCLRALFASRPRRTTGRVISCRPTNPSSAGHPDILKGSRRFYDGTACYQGVWSPPMHVRPFRRTCSTPSTKLSIRSKEAAACWGSQPRAWVLWPLSKCASCFGCSFRELNVKGYQHAPSRPTTGHCNAWMHITKSKDSAGSLSA